MISKKEVLASKIIIVEINDSITRFYENMSSSSSFQMRIYREREESKQGQGTHQENVLDLKTNKKEKLKKK